MPRSPLVDSISLSEKQRTALNAAIVERYSTAESAPFANAARMIKNALGSTQTEDTIARMLRRALSNHASARKEKRSLTPSLRRMLDAALGHDIVKAIVGASPGTTTAFKVSTESTLDIRQAARIHQALDEKGQLQECAELAVSLAKQAEQTSDYITAAQWHSKAASNLRRLGQLHESFRHSEQALLSMDALSADAREAPRARLITLEISFGLVVNRTTMLRGDFNAGFLQHTKLEKQAEVLAAGPPGPTSDTARLYVWHIRRQQSECLRYMGRYSEALRLARRCEKAYASYDSQPRLWARSYQADNLRLLGRMSQATFILKEAIDEAALRNIDQKVTFQWRLASMLLEYDRKEADRFLASLEASLPAAHLSRWANFYTHIVLATAALPNAVRARAYYVQATKAAEITSTDYRLEFAYLRLVDAEIARQEGRLDYARASFRSAHDSFIKTSVKWGQVRAIVGLLAVGDKSRLDQMPQNCEGLDLKLSTSPKKSSTRLPGALAFNFP